MKVRFWSPHLDNYKPDEEVISCEELVKACEKIAEILNKQGN